MHRILPFAVLLLSIAPLLFSIAPLPALAQEVGLHLTVARTTLSESDDEADPAIRIGGGGSLDLPFTDNVGFRTGIFLVRKGATFGEEMPVSGGTYFDYIEVPALLRIGIPVEGRARPYFLLGPALAINVGCSIEIGAGGTSLSQDCDDVNIPIRRLDLGLTGGVGIALTSQGGVSFRLDTLYNPGLRAVADDGGEKHRAITGQVGIAFPIG